MANPVTIRQRVSLGADRQTLVIRQQQNNQTTYTEIPLEQRKGSSRDIHNITELAGQWPRTRVKVDRDFDELDSDQSGPGEL